jgi:hypothetical protein
VEDFGSETEIAIRENVWFYAAHLQEAGVGVRPIDHHAAERRKRAVGRPLTLVTVVRMTDLVMLIRPRKSRILPLEVFDYPITQGDYVEESRADANVPGGDKLYEVASEPDHTGEEP